MKIRLFLFVGLLQFINVFSQTQIKDSIPDPVLAQREQVKAIVNVPYDKAVADIENFEILVDQAIQISRSIKDSLLLAQAMQQKILVLHFTSKSEEALDLSLQAIRIYEKLKMPIKVGEIYIGLGWKLKHRDLDKAFSYMQKGIKIREANKDNSLSLYGNYDNFGVLYGMKKQWDSARFYHEKALEFKKKIKDSVGIPFGYAHLANVYLNTKKYNLAEKYLDSSLVIRQKRRDIYGITDSKLYLGDLFYAKKEYHKAIANFMEAYVLSDAYQYYPLKKYAAKYLYKSNNSIKNYKEALKYHIIYNKLEDSVTNVNTNSKIAELEIEYQIEKKEKEIITQRANIAEKELSINRKNTQLFGLVIATIILGLLGYLIYNQQKLKNNQLQKENQLKDALAKIETQNSLQEQRLRISRDLHDNIGAQLTFIISSIDNLKYGFKLPEKLNNKLNVVSQFTGATIYELRDTIWAMNKSKITLEDLQSRISNFVDKANLVSDAISFQFKAEESTKDNVKLSSVQGMNLYRIMQEAVNNAVKYAQASKIEVYVHFKNNQLHVSVLDNGLGFNINTIEKGNGLNNMKKRAQEIQAELEIISEEKKGTTIKIIM
ncbi:MAG: tetratricopeptide repeat-containing sensor histidine kinase [Oceanihabitans sp.]